MAIFRRKNPSPASEQIGVKIINLKEFKKAN
jgi:hypothetical protein